MLRQRKLAGLIRVNALPVTAANLLSGAQLRHHEGAALLFGLEAQ